MLDMTFSIQPFLTSAAFLLASGLSAQTDAEPESVPSDSTKVYDIVEQVPVWGSCVKLTGKEAETCTYEQLAKHVVAETKYPKKARKKGH